MAVIGALVDAAAHDGGTLVVARPLLGLGSAGSFMGGVATVLSWMFAPSNIRTLAATSPLALATRMTGWRTVGLR